MKLIPASRARWMIRTLSSWSVLPQAPNIIAPRHSGLTCTPVRASRRCSIARTLASGARGPAIRVPEPRFATDARPAADHRGMRSTLAILCVALAWLVAGAAPAGAAAIVRPDSVGIYSEELEGADWHDAAPTDVSNRV